MGIKNGYTFAPLFAPNRGCKSNSKEFFDMFATNDVVQENRDKIVPVNSKNIVQHNRAGIIKGQTGTSVKCCVFNTILEKDRDDNTTTKSLILAQDER